MNSISTWIKKYCTDHQINSLIIGVSGGIDSALTSKLCAISNIKTYVVTLPIHQNTSQHNRAITHINWLSSEHQNIEHINKDLSNVYDEIILTIDGKEKRTLASANTRARLRMTALYHIAQNNNGIVVGTGNKVEDFGVGFFTKYGDGGVDISPIADLTKTDVRKMAKELGVSEEILVAAPTDGLWEDNRTDEDQIGATYEELEWCMDRISNPNKDLLTKREKEVIKIYNTLHAKNLHKMKPIPVYKKKDL